jgi:deoxyribose-phosphate aldolase
MNASLTRDELAQYVDHTLLKPESTPEDVQRLIAEGAELGAFSVCISPNLVPVEVPEGLKLAVVCGFPSGAHAAEVKAAEAAHSAAAGVDEIDMVINLALARTGRFDEVEAEIRAVREAAPNVLLKVIIESAALTDEQIVAACGRLGVKASGGIRDTETALKMIAAGATRLGLSGTKAVLDGLDA